MIQGLILIVVIGFIPIGVFGLSRLMERIDKRIERTRAEKAASDPSAYTLTRKPL